MRNPLRTRRPPCRFGARHDGAARDRVVDLDLARGRRLPRATVGRGSSAAARSHRRDAARRQGRGLGEAAPSSSANETVGGAELRDSCGPSRPACARTFCSCAPRSTLSCAPGPRTRTGRARPRRSGWRGASQGSARPASRPGARSVTVIHCRRSRTRCGVPRRRDRGLDPSRAGPTGSSGGGRGRRALRRAGHPRRGRPVREGHRPVAPAGLRATFRPPPRRTAHGVDLLRSSWPLNAGIAP